MRHAVAVNVSGSRGDGPSYPGGAEEAIANGVYGSWTPSAAEVTRLQEIFPSGVCDYSQPDVGRP